jgi:hypothetical protein
MVKTEALVFDGGNDDGNGNLTTRTIYVEDSATDKRESTMSYNWRDWLIAEVNPVAPHLVHSYDNQARRTATAGYSSSSGLGASSVPTTATNRVSYDETYYDEKGRVWKTVRHEIDVSDGSDDDSLDAESWYDEEGRVVKRDGEQLQKWRFDRLGRQTHEFTLAEDDDSAYAHAGGTSGDIILGRGILRQHQGQCARPDDLVRVPQAQHGLQSEYRVQAAVETRRGAGQGVRSADYGRGQGLHANDPRF